MHLSVRWGKTPNYSHNRLLQCKIAFSGEMWLTVVYISSIFTNCNPRFLAIKALYYIVDSY